MVNNSIYKTKLILKYGNKSYFNINWNDIKSKDSILINCSEHGDSYRKINNLLDIKSKHPCKNCSLRENQIIKNKKLRKLKIDLANELHSNKYDYSNLPENLHSTIHVDIICPLHGNFTTVWGSHARPSKPSGCSKCSRIKPRQYYIDRANKKHGVGTYSYNLLPDFVYSTEKYTFICNKHNIEFDQQLYSHCNNSGCPSCGREIADEASRSKVSDEEWLSRFIDKHGDRYDYSFIGSDIIGRKKTKIYMSQSW